MLTEKDKSRVNLFLSHKAIAMSPWMTSAPSLPIPMNSRNSLAGDAQKVLPVRMKFPLAASVLFLPDFVCGYLGMPAARGGTVSMKLR